MIECLQLTRPIFDKPKSVSFICPSEVINRLKRKEREGEWKEGGRERGREGKREGGREGKREGGREGRGGGKKGGGRIK